MRKTIIFIGITVNNDPNRTQYQRCLFLSKRFNTFVFLANNEIPFPLEISRLAKGVYRLPLPPVFRFLFPLWVVVKALFILHQKPQNTIVYSTYHSLSVLSGAIFKFFGFQTIVDIWDDPLLPVLQESKRYRKNKAKLLFNKILSIPALRLLKTFDAVILALSQDFKQILDKYGVKEERIFHVTNGVDIELIKRYQFCGTYKKNNFTVCYVGHVSWITGCDILVEAILKLHKKYDNIKLELIGDYNPKEERWLEEKFKLDPDLKDIIRIRGYLPHRDVLDLVAKSIACVYPFPMSREHNYSYPIKVFEYMTMGKAIVASKLKGVEELLVDNRNVLFFKPGSATSLTRKLEKLYQNKDLRTNLGQNAAKDVVNYEWFKINERIANYLNEL